MGRTSPLPTGIPQAGSLISQGYFFLPWVLPGISVSWLFAGQAV